MEEEGRDFGRCGHDIRHHFRHFHDYYSRTYPRYEAYTDREREHDFYNAMRVFCENNNRLFEDRLYYSPDGTLNPVFKTNVLCAVGDSISSDLSNSMFEFMAKTIPSDEFAPYMFSATEKVLSNDEISSAMKNPVKNVIPSEEVSGTVVATVARGITVEKILGQKGIEMVDNNKNGIPDEYDDSLQLIWGGLGA